MAKATVIEELDLIPLDQKSFEIQADIHTKDMDRQHARPRSLDDGLQINVDPRIMRGRRKRRLSSKSRSSRRSNRDSRDGSEGEYTDADDIAPSDEVSQSSKLRDSKGFRSTVHSLSRATNIALDAVQPKSSKEQKRVEQAQRHLAHLDEDRLATLKRADDESMKSRLSTIESRFEQHERQFTTVAQKFDDSMNNLVTLVKGLKGSTIAGQKDPPICQKINKVKINASYPTIEAPELNVKSARKAILAWVTPLIYKGGLKKHD